MQTFACGTLDRFAWQAHHQCHSMYSNSVTEYGSYPASTYLANNRICEFMSNPSYRAQCRLLLLGSQPRLLAISMKPWWPIKPNKGSKKPSKRNQRRRRRKHRMYTAQKKKSKANKKRRK